MKRSTTKRALLMSGLAMLLSISMLVGTTFAWFTDSVSSANNVIVAGNLDVELYYQVEGQTDWTKVDANTNVFMKDALWEPGHTEVVKLKVVNEGTLALKYQLGVNVASETSSVNVLGEEFKLSDYIKYGIVDGAPTYTRDQAVAAVDATATALNSAWNSGTVKLEAKNDTDTDEKIVTMVVYMPTTVGNEANYAKGQTRPTINLGISLFATQVESESDSFDNTYDKDAWVDGMQVLSAKDLQAAINNGETAIVLMDDIVIDEPIVIPAAATTYSMRSAAPVTVIDLNGKTINTALVDGSTTNHVYAFTNNGNLLLKNGTINARGIFNYGNLTIENITINAIDGNGGYAIRNYEGSTFTMSSGKIATTLEDDHKVDKGGYDATTLRVDAGAYAEINGGIIDNICDFTFAIDNAGEVVVNGGTIKSVHSTVSTYGTMTINGGSFTCNGIEGVTAHALVAWDGSNTTINGGTFDGKDNYNGFNVDAVKGANVVINGGSFLASHSGSLYGEGNIKVKGGTFVDDPYARVAEGYEAVANGDGTYTVVFPQESFDSLIENAGDNATIEIPAGEYTFPASDLKAGQTLNCAPGTVFVGTSGLNINGATVIGATFDAGDKDTSASGTINGTFKNCTFTGGSEGVRWCYTTKETTTVFENCVFEATLRGIHFDGMDGDVKFINCEINGFNAIGGEGTVTFEGCTFGNDQSRYNGLNMYCNTVLTNCTFNYVSGKTNFIDFEAAGKSLTITNCTATLDKEAANVLDFVGGTYKNQTSITVDGAVMVATAEALNKALNEGKSVILTASLENVTIKLPATLNNVTIKGAEGAVLKNSTISAADGNSYSYVGLTFDGLTFDNSRLLFTGWRNGEETIKDLTITNCVFTNLDDTTNSAPVHINKDAAEAVENFTFTNNVINGATGGSKSGIYAQATGKVVVTGNVINNVSFRPYVIQITTDDGIADEFIVKGNTFSGSSVGRAQGLGNNAEGTDTVKVVVSGNIFMDITGAQQICYWNFNAEKTTADLSENYYDIDIAADPSRIYFNKAAASVEDLVEMGVYPIYTELNADGTINTASLKTAP